MVFGSTLGHSLPTASFTTGAGPGVMIGAAADNNEYTLGPGQHVHHFADDLLK